MGFHVIKWVITHEPNSIQPILNWVGLPGLPDGLGYFRLGYLMGWVMWVAGYYPNTPKWGGYRKPMGNNPTHGHPKFA